MSVLSDTNLNGMLQNFLRDLDLPGYVLFSKVWGSHSHQTAVEDSDVDYLVVYAAPTCKVLSLDPPKDTVDGKNPDFQAHEVFKFCKLLLKGNPGIIEMLFTDKLAVVGSDHWEDLQDHRKEFLTHVTVKQYLGYAQGQLQRLQKKTKLHTTGGKYNTKWAYHMLRLLGDCQRIVRGVAPEVWKEGTERDTLMKVRAGGFTESEVVNMARARVAWIDERKPWPIPEKMPKDLLDLWLRNVRNAYR